MSRAAILAGVICAIVLVWAGGWHGPVRAQENPVLTPVPKDCEVPAETVIASSPLPNIATALRDRKKITILAIGSTSAAGRAPGGYYTVVERILESTFKGLDVEVINRGVSGELAADAAERIKNEVSLAEIDLVLWQLGTADALAQVPVADFYVTVSDTVTWLKEHKIDVILVGLRYTKAMAKDLHYQAIRTAIKDVAAKQNVLRIGRYEAEEMLERIRREQGTPISEAAATEASYVCMAAYLARAIAAGLFVRAPPKAAPSRNE